MLSVSIDLSLGSVSESTIEEFCYMMLGLSRHDSSFYFKKSAS